MHTVLYGGSVHCKLFRAPWLYLVMSSFTVHALSTSSHHVYTVLTALNGLIQVHRRYEQDGARVALAPLAMLPNEEPGQAQLLWIGRSRPGSNATRASVKSLNGLNEVLRKFCSETHLCWGLRLAYFFTQTMSGS